MIKLDGQTVAAAIAAAIIIGGLFYLLVIRPAPEEEPGETIEQANERLMDLRENYRRSKEG